MYQMTIVLKQRLRLEGSATNRTCRSPCERWKTPMDADLCRRPCSKAGSHRSISEPPLEAGDHQGTQGDRHDVGRWGEQRCPSLRTYARPQNCGPTTSAMG